MATPDELQPFEDAARIYCGMCGKDPDEAVQSPHPILIGSTISEPMWHTAARHLMEFSMMLTALKQAKDARIQH